MSFGALIPSEIWHLISGIWPDFAKSAICNLAGIWIFTLIFNRLMGSFQISDGHPRNLIRNLDYLNKFRYFRQIPDFGKSTPKGVGELPPSGGEVHHPPLGKFLGPKSQSEERSDDGGRYRQASTAVVFHPSSPLQQETTHG